jgi:hypothetical protein
MVTFGRQRIRVRGEFEERFVGSAELIHLLQVLSKYWEPTEGENGLEVGRLVGEHIRWRASGSQNRGAENPRVPCKETVFKSEYIKYICGEIEPSQGQAAVETPHLCPYCEQIVRIGAKKRSETAWSLEELAVFAEDLRIAKLYQPIFETEHVVIWLNEFDPTAENSIAVATRSTIGIRK